MKTICLLALLPAMGGIYSQDLNIKVNGQLENLDEGKLIIHVGK